MTKVGTSLLVQLLVLWLASEPAGARASPLHRRDGSTATVDLSNSTGTPEHLASGLLYGVPDTQDQVPSQLYTDMDFNYLRAGGAQVPEPGRGWIWGMTEYKNRFTSALSNYQTARSYNAPFILLIHDLYGCDGTQNSTTPYPGDNGSWTFWDDYLTQLLYDLRANNALSGLVIDIWNEPDGAGFWARSQPQYLDMWGRTFARLRTELGTDVQLSGPASAGEPLPSNGWWMAWAEFVSSNNSVPDQYAWHMEGGGGDMLSSYGGLQSILAQYNLPQRLVNINEYAVQSEQVPSGSAWWISQLERVNARGLRGNWLSGWQLHDFLASLLGKTGMPDTYTERGTGYYPNDDYQVYKYYAQSMTGHRVGSTPSSDGALDVYGTVSADTVRLLVGVRVQTGTWYLTVNNLSAVGLPASGTLSIHTQGFPDNGDYVEVDGPKDLGAVDHPYSGDTITFPIYQTDSSTAYAFEFAVGST